VGHEKNVIYSKLVNNPFKALIPYKMILLKYKGSSFK